MKKQIKDKSTIIVYTTGVFDLLHPGHLNLLKRARALGDKLIVGVQEDDSVEEQKGKRPIMTCEQRMAMLEALPFVDVVLPYSDLDQRKMVELLKPDIMVQGGDWLKSGNRTVIIKYLEENNIKLVQFPYTKGISTTEIKKRVYSDLKQIEREKALDFDFYKRLRLVLFDNLLTYEDYDPKRVERLIHSISSSKTFFNPLTAGEIGEENKYLVIDGANRLEALRRLKASYVFVQIVDYLNPNEVELKGNEHYLNCSPSKFKDLVSKVGISIESVRESDFSLICKNNGKQMALIYLEDKPYCLNLEGNLDLSRKTELLNKFVSAYKNSCRVCRKSETGDVSRDYSVVIKFKKFTPSDIMEIVYKHLRLESGITWHVVDNSVIHFRIPLKMLIRGFIKEEDADMALREIIKKKVENLSVRRYTSNIYVCDEWEL